MRSSPSGRTLERIHVQRTRFFSVVWRINALLILGVGIGAFSLLLVGGTMLVKDFVRPRHTENVAYLAPNAVDKSASELGPFEAVEGTGTLRAALRLTQDYSIGSIAKESSSVQNYLYVDTGSHASHWLIPDNRGLIVATMELPAGRYGNHDQAPLEAVVYELADADTDGDKRLTKKDLITVAVSDPEGRSLVRLFRNVQRLNGAQVDGKGKLVILYTAQDKLHVAEIALASGKVLRDDVMKL
jgi:hypothetical protein